VKVTTSIADVPPACAELWEPYDVSEVPPDDILQEEHVPPAPPVQNMTDGAVSDATAQMWADANNRGSGWYAWADANDQPAFLLRIGAANLINNPTEQSVLGGGGHIIQPACNLYPSANSLFKIDADGSAFFSRQHLAPSDLYVIVIRTANGPCAETLVYTDGNTSTLIDFTSAETVFVAGRLISDPLLGPIWYTDGGGSCMDAGAPSEWCGR
jgi:hypothetical protein